MFAIAIATLLLEILQNSANSYELAAFLQLLVRNI